MVYMETTTEQRPCVYCAGAGTVWGGGVYAPRRRCLICKGSGITPGIHAGVEVPITTTGVY